MSSRKDRNSDYKKRCSGNTGQNVDDFSDRHKGGVPTRQKTGYHSGHMHTGDEDWEVQRDPWQYGSGPVWHAGDGSGPSSWQGGWPPRPGDPWECGPLYTSFEGSSQGPHWNSYMRVPPVGMHMPFFQNQYMGSYPPRQCFSSWQGKNQREGRNRKTWAAHFDNVVKNRMSDRSEIHSTDMGRHEDPLLRRTMESGRNLEYHEDGNGRRPRTIAGDASEPVSTSRSRKNADGDSTSPVRKDNLALSLKASEIIDKVLNKNKGAAKTTSLSNKDSNEVADTEGAGESDRSAALLIQAESLCRDLREKRQLLRMEKESQEKRKSREQKDKIDEKLSSLSQMSKSRMRGYINEESLIDSQVQVHKQRRELEQSASRTSIKSSSLSSHSATSQKGSSTAVRQSAKGTLRPNLSGAFRISRTQKKPNELIDKKNLVRLVNSPRSRKERMQVAKILQSHGKNIRAIRPKLNLESAAGEHGEDYDDEESPLAIDLESLPAEVQEELAELFNAGFEITDIDNASADSDTPMELEDLHGEMVETVSDSEDKPEESQARDGQQIDISFSSKVTDPIIIYSDDANEKSSPSRTNQKPDQKLPKRSPSDISECIDILPSPEKMRNVTSRYEQEDQYYHDLLDSIFSRSGNGNVPIKACVKEEMASSDTDEDSPYQEMRIPFQDDMDEQGTAEQSVGPLPPACSSPKSDAQANVTQMVSPRQMAHKPEELQVSTLESHLAMLTSSPGSKRRQRSQLSSPDALQMSPVGSLHKRPKVDNHSSPGPDTCVDQVLEISLQEEEVRVKIEETNSAITRLKLLLQQTQEQLQRRMQFRQEMLEREANLRSRRLQILKGAVAERLTPQLTESAHQQMSVSQLEQSEISTPELSLNTEPDPKPDSSEVSPKDKKYYKSDKKEAADISIKQEPDSGVADPCVDMHVQDKQAEPDTTVSQHISEPRETDSCMQQSMETCGSDHESASQDTNTQREDAILSNTDASSLTGSAKTMSSSIKHKTRQKKKSKIKSRGTRRTSTGDNTVCIADSTEESVRCSSDTNISNIKKEKSTSPVSGGMAEEGESNEKEKQKDITMEYMGTLSGEATHMDLLKELAVSFRSMSQDTYVFLQESDIVGQKKSLSDSETVKIKQENGDGKPQVQSTSANPGKSTKLSSSTDKFQKPLRTYTGVTTKTQRSQVATSSSITRETNSGTDLKVQSSVAKDTDSDSMMSSLNSKSETVASRVKSPVIAETEASSLVESDCVVLKSPAKKRSPRKQILKVVPSSHPAIRKKFRKKKEKEADSNVLNSSTDSIAECNESSVKDTGTRRKVRTNKDPAVKLLQAYLHAESSSDVDLLSGPEQKCEEGNKKGQEKETTETRSPSDTNRKLKKKKVKKAAEGQADKGAVESSTVEMENDPDIELVESGEVVLPVRRLYTGHTAAIHCLLVWQDLLFSASEDQTAQCFQIQSCESIQTYKGHSKGVRCLWVTKTGAEQARLFTGGFDSMLLMFNIQTADLLFCQNMDFRVHCFHEYLGKLYIGLGNGEVTCMDLKTNRIADRFHCSSQPITCVTSAKEGCRHLLCVASSDCSISVRDAQSGLLMRSIEGHTKVPLSLQVVNQFLYSGSADRTCQVHNISTGELEHLVSHRGPVSGIFINHDNLFTVGFEGYIRSINMKTKQLEQVYYGAGQKMVLSLTVNYPWLFTGNKDGIIEAVRVAPGERHACKHSRCTLVFGLKEDLLKHTQQDHYDISQVS